MKHKIQKTPQVERFKSDFMKEGEVEYRHLYGGF